MHAVIDDHRLVAYAGIHDRETAAAAIAVLRNATAWFATRDTTAQRVPSNNGSAYRSEAWRDACAELGITPKRIRPYRPRSSRPLPARRPKAPPARCAQLDGQFAERAGRATSFANMIVRVSEAHLRVGMEAEFTQLLLDLVDDFPRRHPGLLRHEVLLDRGDPRKVQYVSTWSSEAALVAYAGDDWRSAPVTFPDEDRFLARPLDLRHFQSIPIPP